MTEFFPVFTFILMIVMTILSLVAFIVIAGAQMEGSIELGPWALGGILVGAAITFCACLSMAIVLAPMRIALGSS